MRTTGALGGISAEQMSQNLAMLEARSNDLSDALFNSRKGMSKSKTRVNKKSLPVTEQINVNKMYWESVLVPELNNKFVYTKSNLTEHFRKRFFGNVSVCFC